MLIFDVFYWGVYKLLEKSIYNDSKNDDGFGPKIHSFLIVFLFYGINLSTILSYLSITLYRSDFNFKLVIFLILVLYALGYLIYFKYKRAENILSKVIERKTGYFYMFISVLFLVLSFIIMISWGNEVRSMNILN